MKENETHCTEHQSTRRWMLAVIAGIGIAVASVVLLLRVM